MPPLPSEKPQKAIGLICLQKRRQTSWLHLPNRLGKTAHFRLRGEKQCVTSCHGHPGSLKEQDSMLASSCQVSTQRTWTLPEVSMITQGGTTRRSLLTGNSSMSQWLLYRGEAVSNICSRRSSNCAQVWVYMHVFMCAHMSVEAGGQLQLLSSGTIFLVS